MNATWNPPRKEYNTAVGTVTRTLWLDTTSLGNSPRVKVTVVDARESAQIEMRVLKKGAKHRTEWLDGSPIRIFDGSKSYSTTMFGPHYSANQSLGSPGPAARGPPGAGFANREPSQGSLFAAFGPVFTVQKEFRRGQDEDDQFAETIRRERGKLEGPDMLNSGDGARTLCRLRIARPQQHPFPAVLLVTDR